MDEREGQIDLGAQELAHAPLVATRVIPVEPPSLRDNTALAERLARAVSRDLGLTQVHVPLSVAGGLSDLGFGANDRFQVAVSKGTDTGRIVSVAPPGDRAAGYGLAVDVGSTTLVLALVDLERPCVIDRFSLTNPQMAHGADILTRAHFAERPGGLETLTRELREAINRGLAVICERQALEPGQLVAGAVAGNTAMTHFLLGLSLRTLIREPYIPVVNRPEGLTAGRLGLNLAPEAPVLVMPNKGAYLGGDLMAGVVVSGMARSDGLGLLVDVGTNAEVVLGQRDWLVGAAGAAGPALEGGVVRMGMIAGPGAIDRVRIDRETKTIKYRTIEDRPPKGICGSGLIDLFAEMFLSGLLDFQGKLTIPPGHPRRLETDDGPAFIVVTGAETENGEPILLSEIEVDLLTRSKAGMYTIISTVVQSVGLTVDQIDRFFVAGTFGQYIDPRMAVAVGMVPDLPLDRFVSLGNSSLQGAILTLISSDARSEVSEIWQKMTYLEMNVNQDLMNRFSAARFLPHTNRNRFPSVGTTIA